MNLHILSLEGQFYLVESVDENGKHLLTDSRNKPHRFHCLEEIRDHFNHHKLEEVWLEQLTPYEEMCGLDDDTAPLKIKLNW